MLGFDRRGDAQRGDFDGLGFGTIAATSSGGAIATAPARAAAAPGLAALTGAAGSRSLLIGLAFFGGLLVYAHRRIL